MNRQVSNSLRIIGNASVIVAIGMFSVQSHALDESPVSAQLLPARQPPPRPVGSEWRALKNGKPWVITVTAIDGEYSSYRDSSGCEWTLKPHSFGPVVKFKNCSGASGTQNIYKTKGSPWPMKVGTKFQYS